MNFYKSQDEAIKKTKILVFYYVLAIIGTILFLYTLSSIILMYLSGRVEESSDYSLAPKGSWLESFWDLNLFGVVGVGTTAVILVGWGYKKMQIGGGGNAVAQAMGARPVDPATRDPDERQLVNVVEEMAIASGLPVPQIWVMDQDSGINAFAAGTDPGNAVIGVTRGTMQRLSRAELQGVVAHEFSHILNGDMKLNIRLMCMLHGLLLISIIGYTVLRIAFYSGSGRRRSREEGNLGLMLAAFGIAFIIVGVVGAFFASMIQAAISRQREYLADAYAVEFTMDPSGIAGALKKIGGNQHRAAVSSPVASEMEHMFFASSGLFQYGFATHPPLEERIEIIEPEWDGEYLDSSVRDVHQHVEMQRQQRQPANPLENFGPAAIIAGAMMDDVGESSQMDMRKGQAVVGGLEQSWIDACHDKYQAQLLTFGLLLAEDGKLHAKEVSHLRNKIGDQMTQIAVHWQHVLKGIHSSTKIALIDLCVPTLRRLSAEEYQGFISLTQWLIRSDSSVDLFEFMLQKLLQRHLDAHFVGVGRVQLKHRSIVSIQEEVNVVVSTLAGVGAASKEELDSAYQEANQLMMEHGCPASDILAPDRCCLDAIDQALEQIDQATPIVKQQFLLACGKVVMHDGEVISKEAELLRATADAIGCSIPPFVAMK